MIQVAEWIEGVDEKPIVFPFSGSVCSYGGVAVGCLAATQLCVLAAAPPWGC